jgi:hypothetical protein
MYVLQATTVAAEGITAGTHIFPADRCVWTQTDVAGTAGYSISNARFIGNGANTHPLTAARLGFIGKSGRFVPISD